MAFGFGPGAEMMKSYKANRAQMSQRKKEIRERNVGGYDKNANGPNALKVATPEQIAEARRKTELDNKKELRKNLTVGGVCLVLVLGVMTYFLI